MNSTTNTRQTATGLTLAPASTAPNPATATTSLETHTEFPSTAGHNGFMVWQEQVEYQRAGYALAGVSGRVKTCGTVPIVSGRVALGTIGKGVSIKGLHRCGGRWCAECQTKIGRHKSGEVEQAMTWAIDHGLIPVMYTVTGAHATVEELDAAGGSLHIAVQGIDATTVRKRMSQAWANTRNGRRGVALRHQRVGMITAQEVTLDDVMFPGSRTGLHWHRHVLVLLHKVAGQSARETADNYGNDLFDLWQAGCAKVGLNADVKAFDVQVAETKEAAVELGKYIAKGESAPELVGESYAGNLHVELTRADGKNAGKGRVSPEQLLRNIGYMQAVAPSNTTRMGQMVAQWKDLEKGTKGVHWVQWSPGLRDLVGLNDELSDDEIAQLETPVDSDTVAVVTWDDLREHVGELRRVVRESDDGDEFATLLLCLDSWGVSYVLQSEVEWSETVTQRLRSIGNESR